jgi:uncharacterized protein YjbJ (UPF0337 family)
MEEQTPKTATGPLGKMIGRAKEAAGAVTGDEALSREGRLQQAGVAAQKEATDLAGASRQREAEARLAREKLETGAARERLQAEVGAKEQTAR